MSVSRRVIENDKEAWISNVINNTVIRFIRSLFDGNCSDASITAATFPAYYLGKEHASDSISSRMGITT